MERGSSLALSRDVVEIPVLNASTLPAGSGLAMIRRRRLSDPGSPTSSSSNCHAGIRSAHMSGNQLKSTPFRPPRKTIEIATGGRASAHTLTTSSGGGAENEERVDLRGGASVGSGVGGTSQQLNWAQSQGAVKPQKPTLWSGRVRAKVMAIGKLDRLRKRVAVMQDMAHQEVERIRNLPKPKTESEKHQEWMDNQNLIRKKFEEERMQDQHNKWRQEYIQSITEREGEDTAGPDVKVEEALEPPYMLATTKSRVKLERDRRPSKRRITPTPSAELGIEIMPPPSPSGSPKLPPFSDFCNSAAPPPYPSPTPKQPSHHVCMWDQDNSDNNHNYGDNFDAEGAVLGEDARFSARVASTHNNSFHFSPMRRMHEDGTKHNQVSTGTQDEVKPRHDELAGTQRKFLGMHGGVHASSLAGVEVDEYPHPLHQFENCASITIRSAADSAAPPACQSKPDHEAQLVSSSLSQSQSVTTSFFSQDFKSDSGTAHAGRVGLRRRGGDSVALFAARVTRGEHDPPATPEAVKTRAALAALSEQRVVSQTPGGASLAGGDSHLHTHRYNNTTSDCSSKNCTDNNDLQRREEEIVDEERESGDERALARALSDAFAAPCADVSTPPPPLRIPDVDAPDSTPKKVEKGTMLLGLRFSSNRAGNTRRHSSMEMYFESAPSGDAACRYLPPTPHVDKIRQETFQAEYRRAIGRSAEGDDGLEGTQYHISAARYKEKQPTIPKRPPKPRSEPKPKAEVKCAPVWRAPGGRGHLDYNWYTAEKGEYVPYKATPYEARNPEEEWNNTLDRIFNQDKHLQGAWQSPEGCPTSPIPVRMSKGLQAQNTKSDLSSPSAMKHVNIRRHSVTDTNSSPQNRSLWARLHDAWAGANSHISTTGDGKIWSDRLRLPEATSTELVQALPGTSLTGSSVQLMKMNRPSSKQSNSQIVSNNISTQRTLLRPSSSQGAKDFSSLNECLQRSMDGGTTRDAFPLSQESSRVHVRAGLHQFEHVPARGASTTILAGAESVKAEPGMARASAVAERRRSLVSENFNVPVMAARSARDAYKSPRTARISATHGGAQRWSSRAPNQAASLRPSSAAPFHTIAGVGRKHTVRASRGFQSSTNDHASRVETAGRIETPLDKSQHDSSGGTRGRGGTRPTLMRLPHHPSTETTFW